MEDEALSILASGNMDEIDQLTKIYKELDELKLIPYDDLQYNLTDEQEKELRKSLGLSV